MPTIEKIKPKLSESDIRNKRARVVLKTAVAATTIAAAAILAWVVWTLWNLIGI